MTNKLREYKFIEKIFSIKNASDNFHKVITFCGIRIKYKKILYDKNYKRYTQYVLNSQLDKSKFVPLSEKNYMFKEETPKLISFYLPQFHDFDENVKWFGRGFSEWSNTSKTPPQYVGHWQPHIPIDVGYYNLETNRTIKRQIELAKKYGIYGFCFYYYWFSGKKIMEKPINNFLQDKSLNMPFFLFWANENWTMLWDNGNYNEVLYEQKIEKDDAEKFMNDALPFMKDKRYIKINNKPILIIYDPHKYPYDKYIEFIDKIQLIAKQNGFDGLYLMTTSARANKYKENYHSFLEKYKLEALFEFFPQGITHMKDIYKKEKIINPLYRAKFFDTNKLINEKKYMYDCNANLFKCCFPNWDNTSRKCYNGAFVFQTEPHNYKKWLTDLLLWTKNNKKRNEQFVFINAWNEWAEGAHLEPDQKYGYAYLQATFDALKDFENTQQNINSSSELTV